MIRTFQVKDFFENEEKIHAGFYLEHREINMHRHEFWEISYVYEGNGTHHFENGSAVPIRDGEFIFMSPGAAHCITSPATADAGWVRVCNLLITEEYMRHLAKKLKNLHEFDEYRMLPIFQNSEPFCIHLKDDSGSIRNLMMTAAHEYRHFADGSAQMIENSTFSLLIYITRLYERSLSNETADSTKNDVIDDLLKYIRANFGSSLSLDFLSEYSHLSPEYLSRYFRKYTGMKLSDFITETRIDKAKYRLRTSTWSIQDICEYCGYRSASSFQKAFKKTVGMTAGEYRNSESL